MKLALTAGGTGGHVLPALAVLQAVRELEPETAARFFGPANRGERRLVEDAGVRFEEVPSAGIRGKNPIALARSSVRLSAGVFGAVRKMRAFRPDVVFSTGGYASFPGSLAARLLRIPLVVFLPDVEPGWAVRVEKRLATRIATTTEAARRQLPAEKTYVTGYPVRQAFRSASRDEVRGQLEPGETPVVLVAGASQGSAAINRAIFKGLPALCERATVVHVTGQADATEAEERKAMLPLERRARYRPAEYRDDLPALMVGADLGVMRAGASVLGELPASRLPAILVPGRFAGGHQRANAQWLAQSGGAAVLDETRIGELLPRLFELVDQPAELATMREALATLDRPEAAKDIARIVIEVAKR